MSAKTDNTALDIKVRLRVAHLPDTGNRPLRVLDAYHGTGQIWHHVAHRSQRPVEVLGIDTRDMGPRVLRGDNRKFLASLDLDRFDVIDLDAYGFPDEQLRIVTDAGYRGVIFYTVIRTGHAGVPAAVLAAVGVTPAMRRAAPMLCSKAGTVDSPFGAWQAFLHDLGYRHQWAVERARRAGSNSNTLYAVLNSPHEP